MNIQINPSKFAAIAALAAVATLGCAALAQQSQRTDGPPRGSAGGEAPTQEMLQACISKSEGAVCSAPDPNGDTVQGLCRAPQGRPLACVPADGGPEGGQGGGAFNTGSEMPSTQAYTLGILCGFAVNSANSQLGLPSMAAWSCADGQRRLIANGVPDHPIGQFPNSGNPNRVSVQTVNFAVTTSPIARSGPGARVKEPVMGLNGIKFDPGTAGRCDSDAANPGDCDLGRGTGPWSIEALGQDIFDFGEDTNNAHVQPGGSYHYHGVPVGMLSENARTGREMGLIGWAADGFPVYARYGYSKSGIMNSALKLMEPSYRLKASPDAGRPGVEMVPMGAFTQDWEYVAGLGDLDECNGRFGVTPQFPEGIYHYYATDAYPYVQRCIKGSAAGEAKPRRPEGSEQRRGRGGREGGRGQGREGRGPPSGGRGN